MDDRHSTAGDVATEHLLPDDSDIVPHFQRVSISGEDTSGVSYSVNSL